MSQLSYPLVSARPLNGWQLMTALINGDKAPSNAWKKTSFRLKFLSRSLLNWRTTRGLLSTLAANPLLDEILRAQPNLPCKLHRPYLAANMNKIECLFALRDHYDLLVQRMPLKMRLGHLGRQPFVLASAQGKSGAPVTLELAAIDTLNKEGEATLLLRNANGVMLAEITFALMHYRQQPTLFIGGLQGANHQVPHAEIQQTTKECHGLFPKRLVLEGIGTLARHLGIRQIVAVGNATHIYQTGVIRARRKISCTPITISFGFQWAANRSTAAIFCCRSASPASRLMRSSARNAPNTAAVINCSMSWSTGWRRTSAPGNAARALSPPGRAPARSPARTFSSAAAAPHPCPIRRPASPPRSPDRASTSDAPPSGSPCASASAR